MFVCYESICIQQSEHKWICVFLSVCVCMRERVRVFVCVSMRVCVCMCICKNCSSLSPTLSLERALKPLNSKSAQDEVESGICLQKQPLCWHTSLHAHTHSHPRCRFTCDIVHTSQRWWTGKYNTCLFCSVLHEDDILDLRWWWQRLSSYMRLSW